MDKETFERKCSVVSSAWAYLEGVEKWKPILDHYNLGFPFAHLYVTKMGTLNKGGKQQVIDTYDFLLKAMDVPDSDEYYSFFDVVDARNEKEGVA